MDTIEGIAKPPAVPDKFSIIPIHQSDIAAFNRCRRYWDWSSPTRTNLRHRVEIFGINVPYWYGNGIHYALERYYHPAIQFDPVATFTGWFHLQWWGGTVEENELELTYDPKPVDCGDGTYKVRGLKELLPDDREEEFEAFRELGIGMMQFYKDYAKRNDDFQVIAAETQFSIPLGFEWVDQREHSPNYGKKLEVHARGKRDAIVYRPEVERFAVIDHKTASAIADDYFKKLELDPQVMCYLWASQKEAEIYDLPWTGIQDCIYQALRKAAPKPPTPLKNGFPSLNRAEESTTPEMFQVFIKEGGFELWFEENEKAQAYYNWLSTEGDRNFIQRETTHRNDHEIAMFDEKIKLIAHEMLDSPAIWNNPTGDWLCLGCQFRGPCIAKDDGSDWKGMLVDGYVKNRER